MAEAKKTNYVNIESINNLLGAEGIGALVKEVQGTEKKVNDILRKLSDLENVAKQRAQEEAEAQAAAEKAAEEKAAAEKAAAERAAEVREKTPAPESKKEEPAETPVRQEEKAVPVEESKAEPATEKKEEPAEEKQAVKENVKAEEPDKVFEPQAKPAQDMRPPKNDRTFVNNSDRPARPQYGNAERPQGARPAYGDRPQRPAYNNGGAGGAMRDRRSPVNGQRPATAGARPAQECVPLRPALRSAVPGSERRPRPLYPRRIKTIRKRRTTNRTSNRKRQFLNGLWSNSRCPYPILTRIRAGTGNCA